MDEHLRQRRASWLVRLVALVWLAFLAFPAANLLTGPPPPGWPVPVAAIVVLAAVYLGTVLRATDPPHPSSGLVGAAIIAVIAVGTPLLRGPDWYGGTVFLALQFALILPVRPALLGTLAATVLATLTGVLAGISGWQVLAVALGTTLAGGTAIIVVQLAVTARELTEARSEVAELAAARERLRLARELHDPVKQHLFVAELEIATLRSAGPPPDSEQHLSAAAEAITAARDGLVAAMERLRMSLDLVTELRRFSDEFARRHEVEVAVDASAPDWITRRQAEPALRAAQETMTNAVRHGHATRLGVHLSGDAEELVLVVADAGRGFDPDPALDGYGLRSVRERMAEVGGRVEVHSAPGDGARVTCRLPREGAGWS